MRALGRRWSAGSDCAASATARHIDAARSAKNAAPPGGALALRSVRGSEYKARSPATLSKALFRPCLVYPLASLDVSGQRLVSCADASPNEVFA